MGVIKYILAFVIPLVASLFLYPQFIKFMRRFDLNQQVSEYALSEFKDKSRTPTMGGVIFLFVPLISLLIVDFSAYTNINVVLVVLAFLSFGLIGLYDDYLILVKKDNIGFKTKQKFALEVVLAIIFTVVWYNFNDGNVGLHIPFTNIFITMGISYAFITVFLLSGVSNAVNLTDGMDGLAGGTVFLALIPYAFYAYKGEQYQLVLLILSLLGSLTAYLFYNIKPARVIMGDVGSLSLGAFLAAAAIVTGRELTLAIVGLIFVLETLSVIIQIGSVKLRGKRVFPYTPIHYSFTIWGMKEKNVVYMFWAVGFVLMIIGIIMGL